MFSKGLIDLKASVLPTTVRPLSVEALLACRGCWGCCSNCVTSCDCLVGVDVVHWVTFTVTTPPGCVDTMKHVAAVAVSTSLSASSNLVGPARGEAKHRGRAGPDRPSVKRSKGGDTRGKRRRRSIYRLTKSQITHSQCNRGRGRRRGCCCRGRHLLWVSCVSVSRRHVTFPVGFRARPSGIRGVATQDGPCALSCLAQPCVALRCCVAFEVDVRSSEPFAVVTSL